MIQIIAGGKGEGKTKRVIDMANEAVKNAKGHIAFIDDDNRHMYDLQHDVKFIATEDFVIDDLKVLCGFISGVYSQDRDIEKIFIDGVHNIVKVVKAGDLEEFITNIENLSKKYDVDFVLIISELAEELPEKAKGYVIS